MTINGFVFDFDGLILDTELPRYNAWQNKFSQFGYALSFDDWGKIIGTDHNDYDPVEDLFNRTKGKIDRIEVNNWVEQYTNDHLLHQSLLPGVESFIHQAYQRGFKLAVASSSSFAWVWPFLERFGIASLFDTVLTSRDVKVVKPDPALYLLAVQKLALAPDSVVAFEDSLNGVKSAKAAGLYCVAIPNQLTRSMDLRLADRIVDSFDQLSIGEFC